MPLKIYNTLTERKEEFQPCEEGVVKMFVCGPTVYDQIHLGHARTYVVYDVMARYLSVKGFKVIFIVNITDIDDKVFERAVEEGVDYRELADRYVKEFIEDLKSLHIASITSMPRASDYLEEVLSQIAALMEKGHAYRVEGTVYFDTSTFPEYGKLSHQTPLELKLRRIDPDPRKRNQSDFPLWRGWDGEGPSWPSPYGRGRPGWHIEDTAISISTFGPQYDVHGGAVDLIYPHHEAEIAQAESLTGVKPFVKYWVHTGLLRVEGRKMSKSLGNFIPLRELLKRHGPNALRLHILSRHYRSSFDFNVSDVEAFEGRAHFICQVVEELKARVRSARDGPSEGEGRVEFILQNYIDGFFKAMDDDFDTPRALSMLVKLVEELDASLVSGVGRGLLRHILDKVLQMLFILGLEVP